MRTRAAGPGRGREQGQGQRRTVGHRSGTSAIEVRGLRHVYRRARRPAVEGMSFAVGTGEVFGFLGPSGAGKSTTQRILVRLIAGWQGEVTVLGRDLRTWDDTYYEQVGVSFELPNHYQKLTARENLRTFAALYRGSTEDPDELLDSLGLLSHADERVAGFSKGMQMRLNVARALLPRPALLFLDEPTAGLDPGNARLVRELIRAQQARGCTVFLTTHDMAVADEVCDRVAFVVDGAIARIGAPRDLRLAHADRGVVVEARGPDGVEAHRFPLAGLGDDAAFLALLRSGAVETIHTEEASLSDIFLAVTGRGLA
jgi:fluoroquinolone transport system ATP-binding protein